jgi:hypothetical protein
MDVPTPCGAKPCSARRERAAKILRMKNFSPSGAIFRADAVRSEAVFSTAGAVSAEPQDEGSVIIIVSAIIS